MRPDAGTRRPTPPDPGVPVAQNQDLCRWPAKAAKIWRANRNGETAGYPQGWPAGETRETEGGRRRPNADLTGDYIIIRRPAGRAVFRATMKSDGMATGRAPPKQSGQAIFSHGGHHSTHL